MSSKSSRTGLILAQLPDGSVGAFSFPAGEESRAVRAMIRKHKPKEVRDARERNRAARKARKRNR